MKTPTGGPAFPHAFQRAGDINEPKHYAGMSLRDWFAGQALAGLTVGLVGSLQFAGRSEISAYAHGACNEVLADRAYAVADAMLAERAKEKAP